MRTQLRRWGIPNEKVRGEEGKSNSTKGMGGLGSKSTNLSRGSPSPNVGIVRPKRRKEEREKGEEKKDTLRNGKKLQKILPANLVAQRSLGPCEDSRGHNKFGHVNNKKMMLERIRKEKVETADRDRRALKRLN